MNRGKTIIIAVCMMVAYMSRAGQNMGFLLGHPTGSFPQKSEVDVPINYADYYYLEALLRQKNFIQ